MTNSIKTRVASIVVAAGLLASASYPAYASDSANAQNTSEQREKCEKTKDDCLNRNVECWVKMRSKGQKTNIMGWDETCNDNFDACIANIK